VAYNKLFACLSSLLKTKSNREVKIKEVNSIHLNIFVSNSIKCPFQILYKDVRKTYCPEEYK